MKTVNSLVDVATALVALDENFPPVFQAQLLETIHSNGKRMLVICRLASRKMCMAVESVAIGAFWSNVGDHPQQRQAQPIYRAASPAGHDPQCLTL